MSFEATDYESRRVFAIILPAPQTFQHNFRIQQECIPVGCVPPAAVAVGGCLLPGGSPCGGLGCLLPRGGSPCQGGCLLPGGFSLPGGVPPSWEVSLPGWGGASFPGSLPARGVSLMGDPPPVNRMTNRCKNITLPQTSFAGGKNTRSSQKINSNIYGKQCISLPRLDSSKTF